MIHVENISKSFDGQVALQPISLTFRRAETSILIGPSGCGKSTLLKLLLGLIPADTGRIRFDDVELSDSSVQQIRQRTGYVIQEGGLFPHLTAKENIALLARSIGWTEAVISARIAEIVDITQMPEGKLASYPSQLSGGQRQRVSLMRALMLDPDVLLLDEPLGALDPLIRSELQADLKDIFESLGKTVVMVTHDLAEAAFFADEIVLLREGQIVQKGSFEELQQKPADPFVTKFFGAQIDRVAPLLSAPHGSSPRSFNGGGNS